MRVGLVVYGGPDTVTEGAVTEGAVTEGALVGGTLTGGYLYDSMLVEHLRAQGDQVEVISLPWRNYCRHLGDNLSPSVARRLARAPLDVLVQDELNHPSLVVANRRLRDRRRCPIVAVVHILRADERAGSRLRPLYAAAERRYLNTVDGAVFCCQATRSAAEGLVGRAMPGVVVHPACDHLARPGPEADLARRDVAGPLRVLSVANVVPRKGAHLLIEALSRLPLEGWRLTVVGSLTMAPAYVRRLRHQIDQAGLVANVNLVGAVANPEVPAHLARSHLLAVPSSHEGLAIAYLEAMRFGLPVIATTAGGAGEVIEHGRQGFLVAPGDVDALARHLGALAGDRALLVRMGRAARRRIDDHPTWDQSLAHARTFLCSIVDSHRGGRREGAR